MRKNWDAFSVPGLPEDFQLYEAEVFNGRCDRKLVLTGSVPGYGTCATIEKADGSWAEPMFFHGQPLSRVKRIIVALDTIEAWLLAGGLEAADANTQQPKPEPQPRPVAPPGQSDGDRNADLIRRHYMRTGLY